MSSLKNKESVVLNAYFRVGGSCKTLKNKINNSPTLYIRKRTEREEMPAYSLLRNNLQDLPLENKLTLSVLVNMLLQM